MVSKDVYRIKVFQIKVLSMRVFRMKIQRIRFSIESTKFDSTKLPLGSSIRGDRRRKGSEKRIEPETISRLPSTPCLLFQASFFFVWSVRVASSRRKGTREKSRTTRGDPTLTRLGVASDAMPRFLSGTGVRVPRTIRGPRCKIVKKFSLTINSFYRTVLNVKLTPRNFTTSLSTERAHRYANAMSFIN